LAGQTDGVVLLDGRMPHGLLWSPADAAVPMIGVSVPVGSGVRRTA
jgi:hypothetical protein